MNQEVLIILGFTCALQIIMAKPAGGPRRDMAAAAGAGMDED